MRNQDRSGLLVLAIESAIAGGSLSLIRDGAEVTNWIGAAEVSKGEDLLFNIDAMVKEAGVEKRQVELIAVSAGPGSFTGIRIGIATALGLKKGLDIPMASVSALTAMAFASRAVAPRVIAAIPMGRNAFCYQELETADDRVLEIHEPRTAPLTDLSTHLGESQVSLLVHSSLVEFCEGDPRTIDAGRNIARSIAMACSDLPEPHVVEPLFISKSF